MTQNTIGIKALLSDAKRSGSLLSAFNTAGIGAWDFSADNNTFSFDNNAGHTLGIAGNSISYAQLLLCIHQDDRGRAEMAFQDILNKRSNGSFDITFKTAGTANILRSCRLIGKAVYNADAIDFFNGIAMEAAEQIESSEEMQKLKMLVNNSPDFMGISGNGGSIQFVNKMGRSLLGIDKTIDLEKISAADFYPPDEVARMQEVYKELGEKGSWKGNIFLRHFKTGESIPAFASFESVYDSASGALLGRSVTARDLREELKSQGALIDKEARYRSLIEEAPVATAVYTGRDLRIEIANDMMIRYWGKGKSVMGKPLADALPELKSQPFLQALNDVFTTGKTAEYKATPVDLEVDGVLNTYYFDFTYKAIRDASGSIYGILNMAVDVTEQLLAKWQLEKSQQQLLTYFKQSPVAIAIIDRENLTFKMANPFYGELVGRKTDEIENRPLLEALPELKGQGFDRLLQEVIDTGVPFIANEVRAELLRKGQLETIYVNLTYQPQLDITGNITGILVVATDVTSTVLSRQKTEDSEAKLQSIINTAPLAISLFSGSDLIVEMPNQAFLNMFGKEAAIMGKPLSTAIPELETGPYTGFLKQVYNTGETFRNSGMPVKTNSNGIITERYYDFIYTPILDSEGKVYAILAIFMDVTEQLIHRKKLEEAETNLRGAIDLANLGTWSMDIATRILSYDDRLRLWFGFDDDEVITPERAYAPIYEGDHPYVKTSMLNAITPGSDGRYDVEYKVKNLKTGDELIIHAQGKAMLDDNNVPYKVSGTAQDVTRSRRIELELTRLVQEKTEELQASNEEMQATNEEMSKTNEELEEANQNLYRSNEELSQYAYVASHDLQEPLRKIRVFSGILSQQQGLSNENKLYVEKIDKSSMRMSLLIKDLLEFSRLVKSDKMVRPVELDLIIKEVITDFELIVAEKQAQIIVQRLPVVEAVGLQMNQLFYNIISNALKFVDTGKVPEIIISSRPLAAGEVKRFIHKPRPAATYHDISVNDNGIGFDSAFSEQIFEVFKRLHGKDIYPGSGIGLALCRRIVNNHGGHLYSESAVGKGTTFHVILPVYAAAE